MVVIVHVGAENPHRGQAGLGQGRLNLPWSLVLPGSSSRQVLSSIW